MKNRTMVVMVSCLILAFTVYLMSYSGIVDNANQKAEKESIITQLHKNKTTEGSFIDGDGRIIFSPKEPFDKNAEIPVAYSYILGYNSIIYGTSGMRNVYEKFLYEENGKMRLYMGTSPENAFLADGKIAVIAKYTAMDLSIARDVMLNTAKACEVLGLDSAKYKNYAERIQPLKIGSDGRLLEWNEELPEAEPGHRHLSHLYGVYPSDLIKQGTPEYDAAKKSLEYRLANGGGHTGWSSAWNINVAARFGNGEKAYEFIKTLIKCQLMNNLFDMHPFSFHSVFQIDGNLGFMSGICEMLAYADKDKVVLLPAVPDEWKCGSVKGLCLKGGRKLDIKWDGGRIISYRIYDAKSGKTISNVKTESPRFAL